VTGDETVVDGGGLVACEGEATADAATGTEADGVDVDPHATTEAPRRTLASHRRRLTR
jgi:hypothetical protein